MLTLYYHPMTCSLGVQIALLEAQIEHTLVEVDLAGPRPELRALNPLGTVPALQTDAGVLTETSAIMAWLALNYPDAHLLPSDAFGFAKGLSFLGWLSSSAHIARRQMRFPARFTSNGVGRTEIRESGHEKLMQCLAHIDHTLANRDFVLDAAAPSACDWQLMVYAHWCAADEFPTAAFPHFEQWTERMLQRPRVQQALHVIHSPLAR